MVVATKSIQTSSTPQRAHTRYARYGTHTPPQQISHMLPTLPAEISPAHLAILTMLLLTQTKCLPPAGTEHKAFGDRPRGE